MEIVIFTKYNRGVWKSHSKAIHFSEKTQLLKRFNQMCNEAVMKINGGSFEESNELGQVSIFLNTELVFPSVLLMLQL